jgi:chromosomal replication initiator protein
MGLHANLSLPRISQEFGGKDHTTVMYSCDKIKQLERQGPSLSQILRQLSDKINFASKNQ